MIGSDNSPLAFPLESCTHHASLSHWNSFLFLAFSSLVFGEAKIVHPVICHSLVLSVIILDFYGAVYAVRFIEWGGISTGVTEAFDCRSLLYVGIICDPGS